MKLLSYLLIPIFSVLLTSCARDIAKYPLEWPDIATDNNRQCVSLSGSYDNKAIEAPTNLNRNFHEKNASWSIYLSKILIPYISDKDNFEHRLIDSVVLNSINAGKLEIQLEQNGKIKFKKTLNTQDDFVCTSQSVVLTGKTSPNNMMGISERFKNTTISNRVDGSLLAVVKETEVGTIVVIPYGEKLIQYYRFLPSGM